MLKLQHSLFSIGIFLLLLTSCSTHYEEIRVVKIDNPKVVAMNNTELSMHLHVSIDNPTDKTIHIQQFLVNINDQDKVIATMALEKKITLLKNSEQSYLAELKININNPLVLLKFVYQPELLNTLKPNGILKARSGLLMKTVKFTDKDLQGMGFQQIFNGLVPK